MQELKDGDYQFIRHDGGSYQVKYKGSTELLTFDENMAINHWVDLVQKGSGKIEKF